MTITARTTPTAIREQQEAVVAGLAPASRSGVPFVRYRNEMDFRAWAERKPHACFRKFSIREVGGNPGEYTDGQIEHRTATMELVIAYPKLWAGYGNSGRQGMMDIIREDRQRIDNAIGLYGARNYVSGQHICDARAGIEEGDGVVFLVFDLEVQYHQIVGTIGSLRLSGGVVQEVVVGCNLGVPQQAAQVTEDNGIYFPQDNSEVQGLGVTAGSAIYPFQEASGLPQDVIGARDMQFDVGDAKIYQSSLGGGFTRVGVKFNEATGTHSFRKDLSGGNLLSISAAESISALLYMRVVSPALDSAVFGLASTPNPLSVEFKADGSMTTRIGAQLTDSVSDAYGDDALFPLLITVNRSTGYTGAYTDLEAWETATDPGALTLNRITFGRGIALNSGPPEVTFGLCIIWHDVALDETLLETLGWTLAY